MTKSDFEKIKEFQHKAIYNEEQAQQLFLARRKRCSKYYSDGYCTYGLNSGYCFYKSCPFLFK